MAGASGADGVGVVGADGGSLAAGNSPTDGQSESKKESSSVPELGFWHGFLASISVILVSELGDKTFFIAAIMAMRHPRLTVFVGAISALALMTVLSAVFGMAATIIPRVYTYYISTALFAFFGLKMLKEGYYMSPNEGQEEFEEVQSDLRKREDEVSGNRNVECVIRLVDNRTDPLSYLPHSPPSKSTRLAFYDPPRCP